MTRTDRAWWQSTALWVLLAVVAAILPFGRGFSGTRIFYVRDLTMAFWSRYLWLRRTMLSGEWPLWDPYVGGGQSAVADAMHQMFLLPALLVRFIGGEALGFNLWVAAPFPLAALGAWLFFARRHSAPASTLAAIAFAVSGPVVSTSNFPNMSWSVAALPWVLWAADRLVAAPSPRRSAVLAFVVASQAFAGEPVSMLATLVVCAGFVLVIAMPDAGVGLRNAARPVLWLSIGVGLGLALSAVQLLPMQRAASLSERALATAGIKDFWSLHPLMLVETVSHNLVGDYLTGLTLSAAPWMSLLNSGREPFFFSLYLGVPLLTLAMFGAVSNPSRRWSLFWTATATAGLICAFGRYTPIYPFVRDHLPLLPSFRFPAKYLVVAMLALAAQVAAGWDALATKRSEPSRPRVLWAQRSAIGLSLGIGAVAYLAAGLCLYFPNYTIRRLYDFARSLPQPETLIKVVPPDPVDAAAFMLHALPQAATAVLLISLAAAALVWLGNSRRQGAAVARWGLAALIVCDLVVRAWSVNPVFDRTYVDEPQWLSYTRADPDARFYVGGKHLGTFDTNDPDGAPAFVTRKGFNGAESRAALNAQALFYSSAFGAREILSHDLPVLWPQAFGVAENRFAKSGRDGRDRFLERTGVRYRILDAGMAAGHKPVVRLPYFYDSWLFDWGPQAPRAAVVADATVMPDVRRQIDMLFEDGWDSGRSVLIDRDARPAGNPGQPEPPAALITTRASNHLSVDASAGAGGGYLVLLDSYSADWRVTVDRKPADLLRADGLFRAVHIGPGRHEVEFRYRPPIFLWGAGLSVAALLILVTLAAWRQDSAI